jgi:transposase
MRPPLFVRALTEAERQQLEAGLRSKDAFTLRRCQIVLASAQGQRPAQIAQSLSCASQTVRNALHAFHQRGTQCLREHSHAPTSVQPILDAAKREQVQALLHQSPRTFGKSRSTWTLPLLAQVCQETGLTPQRLRGPNMRDAIVRLGANWKRAKHWISSPDPAYVRKKTDVTG